LTHSRRTLGAVHDLRRSRATPERPDSNWSQLVEYLGRPWLHAVLFSPPLVVALISRSFNGFWWWNDFDAIACSGQRAAQGLSIYSAHAVCPGMRPSAFVYSPQVAHVAGWLQQVLGSGGFKGLYLVLYVVTALWLGWLMFVRPMNDVSLRLRIAALGLVTGGVIACGNIAILCHAMVAGSLLCFRRTRAPFITAVILAAAIKPVFATYLVVLVLDAVPWRARASRLGTAALALAGAAGVLVLTAGPDLGAWGHALSSVVLQNRPGVGFLGWIKALGGSDAGVPTLVGYAAFALILSAAGVVVAELGRLDAENRWLLGLGLAQLINPRLMGYDLQMLAPLIALTAAASTSISPRAADSVGRTLWVVCMAALVLADLSMVPWAAGWAPPVISLLFAGVASGLAWKRLRTVPAGRIADFASLTPLQDRPALSLIICTLDEHEAIGGVIREASAVLEALPHEIIVVDDSPDDRTERVVLACAAFRPNVRLIHRRGESGLASAAIAGWSAARGDVLAVMDGDGQHDPAVLLQLYHRMALQGAEVAVASRYVRRGDTGLRGFRDRISRFGTWATLAALGVRLSDPLSGLFMIRQAWFQEVRPRLSGVGFKILVDVVASGTRRPRTVEAPTALRPRAGGASKLDFRVMADLAALLVEKRTRGLVPARLALFLGVGATGLLVHLGTLQGARFEHAPFWAAQATAVMVAMTSNFALNNALTFRHLRLRGLRALKGLISFCAACTVGAAVNEAIAVGLQRVGGHWTLAAMAGVVAGAFCNYALAQRLTWKAHQPGRLALGAPPLIASGAPWNSAGGRLRLVAQTSPILSYEPFLDGGGDGPHQDPSIADDLALAQELGAAERHHVPLRPPTSRFVGQ
jgi:dolichol-phosphate mannosyltransferase